MKRALLKSANLIGDGLWIGPVAKRWYYQQGRQFDEIHLLTLKNHAVDIYKGMEIPWQIMFDALPDDQYDYTFDFDVSKAFQVSDKKKCHLMNSYADMMGVDITGLPIRPNYMPPIMEVPEHLKNRVLVSPWSLSCSSQGNPPLPPNKMFKSWDDWKPLLETLRTEYPDSKLGVIGGPKDRFPDGLGIQEDEYLLGLPIPETAHAMRSSPCVITLDNGMAHLATSQCARQFYLASYQLALYYIVGWGNPNLRIWHLNPMIVDIRALNEGLKSAIRDWKSQS